MGLTLTALGVCGSFAGAGGACSGYLVQGGGATVWLDAGSGTLANLQHHVGLEDVDAIVLTHEHPDHWTDVEGYHVACTYVLERRGIPVYAPRGLDRLTRSDTEPTFRWHAVGDGASVTVGGLRLGFSRTDHHVETLAVRVEGEGRVLGYSADTGPGWSLSALGDDLDLALVEATFTRAEEGRSLHLSGRQAGETARAAGARRLLVTHMWPTLDPAEIVTEASEAFGRRAETATMNERYFL